MECKEAIILVGGKGTRLRGVVSDTPKPLALVAGRPFLAYVLDHLAASGIRRCILATGYLAEMMENAIGSRWSAMEIAYSVETQPLGTGGAAALATDALLGDSAHLLNGDTFLQYSLGSLEKCTRTCGTEAGVALAEVGDVSRYGAVVLVDGKVGAFQEKGAVGPGLINAGSYFLTAAALSRLSRHVAPFSFETDILLPLASSIQLAAFTDTGRFIDIGIPEDYARAQSIFRPST